MDDQIAQAKLVKVLIEKVIGEALSVEEKELILNSNELLRKRCWDGDRRYLKQRVLLDAVCATTTHH